MHRSWPLPFFLAMACGDSPDTDATATTGATTSTSGSASAGGTTPTSGAESGGTMGGGSAGTSSGASAGTSGTGPGGSTGTNQSETSSSGTGGRAEFTCTHVIGYSQVNQWYTTGGVFESVVDDGRWQLRWNSGGGVDLWQDPGYTGWDNPIESPCAEGSDAPDRVLLSISGPYGEDEQAWAEAIEATVATIRDMHPSAVQIVLQPVVGGPNHQTCTMGAQDVRASWQHAHIDAAIANVVGDDVVAGASPEVTACSDYADTLGHLTNAGAEAAGQAIGEYYQ